uniref:FA core complex associated protein 100 n=1 Tax=Cyprinus carpio TaxID=7962 RepID=A0A8C2GR71_CYPCA
VIYSLFLLKRTHHSHCPLTIISTHTSRILDIPHTTLSGASLSSLVFYSMNNVPTFTYCLTPSSSSVLVNKSTDSVLYNVPDESIVLKNASLQAFTIVKKILVTLSLHKSVWSFDLYEEPGSRPLHKLACFQVVTLNTCLNSPVILCGLPDGRICCFPLLVPTLAGPTGEQRSPVRVLQSLEQPVVFIGTCVSGEHGPQCLVAVGQRGKLLMVKSKQTNLEGKKADYSKTELNEHSVRGPVLCACVNDKWLYYNSLNDLHALQLTTASSSSEATGTESQLQALTSDSLGVCRVIALAGPYTNSTGTLLAVSLSGRLLCVNFPQGSEMFPGFPHLWQAREAESLKHRLQEKNESLKCLNQVINVFGLLLENHRNENACDVGSKLPLSCRGVARWSSLLQRDSLTLTCVLENSSVSQLLTETGSISAPLSTLTVDWLDALRLEVSFSHGNIRHNTVTDGIQAFLHSRGVLTKDSGTTTKSGPITVMVRVSSELLKTKLHFSATRSSETCVSVLNWLVTAEAIGQPSVQSPLICAYSPDGCSVKILVKEVILEDFCSDGPLEVLEIRVESTSVAAVCGLHHAILRLLIHMYHTVLLQSHETITFFSIVSLFLKTFRMLRIKQLLMAQ